MRTPTLSLRPTLLACALLCWPLGMGLVQAQGTANHGHALPSLGDGNDMTLSDERRLGDRIARSIYRDPDYLDDPVLMTYLQSIWQPLVASAQTRGEVSPEVFERLAWELMISRERSVNAFALPGGYLGVHLGLIAAVSSRDELASVLAHELTHVSQRHIARMMTRQSQQMPLMVGAMILGALAASATKNADIAGAAMMGGQAATVQSQLNFSRDMEREADRIGYGVMTGAGFQGQGFVSMFDKLQQASRLNDDGAFPYLRSHPLTTERVADMRSRLPLESQHPTPATASAPTDPLHPLMAARARVLAEQNVDRLRALTPLQKAGTTPETTGAGYRYAAALAAARLRDVPALDGHLQALFKEAPAAVQPAVRALALETMLMTQVTTVAGQDRRALRQEALAAPDRATLLLGARAATADNDAEALQRATERLRTWVSVNAKDALAWQTLAGLHQAQNQPAAAARAEAEYRLAQLDAPGALERLKSAQRLATGGTTDHFEMSILDARVRQVESLVREQLKDERQKP
jgi:beta-barrel assembly-enhancing protease